MYKPNFCAECGSKIARTRWRLWTSRRHCNDCEPRFRKARVLAPLITALALFSTGLIIGRALRPAPPSLIVERSELPRAPVEAMSKAVETSTGAENERSDEAQTASTPEQKYGPSGTANERPTDPNEIISICGARTQKGTPCKRRVRGTGRCWQHRGMPAILPPGKLIVTGN